MLHTLSVLIVLALAVVFGYCGGREHGFHDLLEYFGFDD